MRKLSFEEMENVKGGGWFGCAAGIFAVGTVAVVAIAAPAAIIANPFAAATLVVGGVAAIQENC
jgi:hypothetical protein